MEEEQRQQQEEQSHNRLTVIGEPGNGCGSQQSNLPNKYSVFEII